MEIAYAEMDAHRKHVEGLKRRTIDKLKNSIEGVAFNGVSDDLDKSLYTVLNICLPP
jgi:cysteine desulfurase